MAKFTLNHGCYEGPEIFTGLRLMAPCLHQDTDSDYPGDSYMDQAIITMTLTELESPVLVEMLLGEIIVLCEAQIDKESLNRILYVGGGIQRFPNDDPQRWLKHASEMLIVAGTSRWIKPGKRLGLRKHAELLTSVDPSKPAHYSLLAALIANHQPSASLGERLAAITPDVTQITGWRGTPLHPDHYPALARPLYRTACGVIGAITMATDQSAELKKRDWETFWARTGTTWKPNEPITAWFNQLRQQLITDLVNTHYARASRPYIPGPNTKPPA